MTKTVRNSLTALAVITALLIAVAAFLISRLDRLVVQAVEQYGTEAVGTEVRLKSADISLTESRGTLYGLTIENPPGFETREALRIDEVTIALDPASLTSDALRLTGVLMNGAHLNAEQKDRITNLTELQKRLEQAAPADEVEPGEDAKIIIDEFRLEGGNVTIRSDALKTPQELALQSITVRDIGSGRGGVTYGEAAERILKPILAAGRAAASERLRGEVREAAERKLREEIGGRLGDLLERD